MKKIFRNSLQQKLIFTDEGIIFEARKVFYPYGSIDKIKLGLLGFSVTHNGVPCTFANDSADKQALKEMIDYAIKRKAVSPPAKPMEYDGSNIDASLPKDVSAIVDFFGGMTSKQEQIVAKALPDLVNSMRADEEIVHAFDGSVLYINGKGNAVVWYIALITNKKFYYAGCEGDAYLHHLKTGSVELKDVHAVSMGEGTTTTSAYVKFETKNEDYKLDTSCNTSKIKSKLEEAIQKARETDSVPTAGQSALSSADELKKFKELLDMGIITQAEFDAKKKQLLGL